MPSEPPKTHSHIFCNECNGDRNHAVRATFHARGPEGDRDDDGNPLPFDFYEILQCLGCESVTMWRVWWEGGTYYETPEDGFVYRDEQVTFFPPRSVRPKPKWIDKLPLDFQPILHEIYAALEVDAPTLAAIGVRTVLDVLACKVVGDVGNFPTKLDELEQKGWLSKLDRERLGIVVDAGNAAAHRAFRAPPQALAHMMETLEHLLKSRYILDSEAKALKRATPKRRKPRKKRSASGSARGP
jgi:hypothetical protein